MYAHAGMKSFESHNPVVIFSGLSGEKGFFSSQKHIQPNVAGVDFRRQLDCIVPLREEYAQCNPPFL
jgi:hypothetical protein